MGNNKEIQITTLIGKDAEITGDFSAKGSVRIDGMINGNVTVTGALIIGAGGVINGNISAESAMIGGEVTGNIEAPKKAELTATAKVVGDITTAVIVIDENAVFQGKCDMNQQVPDKKSKARVTKATRTAKKSAKAALAEALKEVAAAEADDNLTQPENVEIKPQN